MNQLDEEHRALVRSSAAFARLPNRTLIEVSGEDRASFLHNLCTNDVKSLQPGDGCEVFFTTVQGKTLLYGLLFCGNKSMLISAAPGHATTILPHLDKYLIREAVTLTDQSNAFSSLWLAGPRADQQLLDLGLELPTNMLAHATGDISGQVVRIARVPFAKEPCFLLHSVTVSIDCIASQLSSTLEVSQEIVEWARIEAGYPSYGTDITDDTLPQEVGRDQQAISFTKGCYLGQETVARIDALGHVNRYLVKLEFVEPHALPPAGSELRNADKVVGKVTSSCWSTPDRAIALGYVRREAVKANAPLLTDFGTGMLAE